MRCTIGIVALALIICPGSVDAGTPQRTAVMKISGVPRQFTVQVDQASPNLADQCVEGNRISEATLEFVDVGGDESGYYVYELKNVLIESVNTGGTNDAGQPTEIVTLNFDEIRVTYTQRQETEQRATPPRYSYTPSPR